MVIVKIPDSWWLPSFAKYTPKKNTFLYRAVTTDKSSVFIDDPPVIHLKSAIKQAFHFANITQKSIIIQLRYGVVYYSSGLHFKRTTVDADFISNEWIDLPIVCSICYWNMSSVPMIIYGSVS